MKKFILATLFALLLASPWITAQAQGDQPIVRAVMFWQMGCPHCEETLEQTLPPLQEKYGAQFELRLIEVASVDDIKTLYDVGAAYGLTREETGVPMLILGEDLLVGSDQVREQLPALIEERLAQGGIDWPTNPILAEFLPAGSPAPALVDVAPEKPKNDGFALAIGIMVFMAAALIYSLTAFYRGQVFPLPAWGDWLIPVLIVIGIGVAGYLSYIETQPVEPICGPIGDCKSVQHSEQAVLFGILPVGIFGLLGYFGLLAAWLARRYLPALEKPATVGFWGMAFFAVVFSLYLTYLEPFVIHAVCIWCLSSAVLVTLLLLLGLPPAVRMFSLPEDME
ncbi:MAG: vitamin K epoxide reductase family protein [Chloroflexi bacterium]|nr:vitamin K epoxide reductase family protein [Chloroflexota bacterium]